MTKLHEFTDANIQSIPAVLLFKDGKVVETMVGVQSKDQYEQALNRSAA